MVSPPALIPCPHQVPASSHTTTPSRSATASARSSSGAVRSGLNPVRNRNIETPAAASSAAYAGSRATADGSRYTPRVMAVPRSPV